ncbi:alpha/beta hydrolase [Micromonospora sp. 067-2]|uniref:alpha/beta hydrolase n=1 Tax=Micromonospora sp. 067-2 TaxID=2789270 RepID=UPI00397AA546
MIYISPSRDGSPRRITTMTPAPRLAIDGPSTNVQGIVLLLHGGRAASMAPSPRGLAYLRMLPFAHAVSETTGGRGIAVWRLRYRYRGWNEPYRHPVEDARWALARAHRDHPGAPIVLVGHSMGGRVALRVGDSPDVAGVCALAPWIEAGEPVRVPRGLPVLIAHGDRDRTTDPEASARYAAALGTRYVPVPNDGHAMLRRPGVWTDLVIAFVGTVLRVP